MYRPQQSEPLRWYELVVVVPTVGGLSRHGCNSSVNRSLMYVGKILEVYSRSKRRS